MKANKLITFLLFLLVMLAVCLTLFSPIPGNIKLIIRIILIVASFVSLRWFNKRGMTELKNIAFVFLVLNLAFLIVSVFTKNFWGLDMEATKGLAHSKFSDSVIIAIVLIFSFLIAGQRLKNIFLTSGKLISGIIAGIVFFLIFGCLALTNPQQKPGPGFLEKNWVWIFVFVLSNGFMEELVFRGIFLDKLNQLFNYHLSVFMTSVCFAVPHIIVQYQPNVLMFTGICLVLGMICGYAMHFTHSIIAPALIYVGADLMIIVPIFATYGVK
jgi:membrane protease YdiL (CAAX protease family)